MKRSNPYIITLPRKRSKITLKDENVSLEDKLEDMDIMFKLNTTKSPVIDTLIYCAINEDGIYFEEENSQEIQVRIPDIDFFLNRLNILCPKINPTLSDKSRLLALDRWFQNKIIDRLLLS